MALFGAKKTKDDKGTKDAADLKQAKVVKEKVKTDDSKLEETKETVDSKGSMKDLYADGGAKKTSKSKKTTSTSRFEGSYRVLVKPLVTEKATDLSANNKYVFVVASEANKIEVAKAINVVYGVKPVAVNIISVKGKVVSRGRIKGQRKDWKKAVVTLKKGDSIKIYEGV